MDWGDGAAIRRTGPLSSVGASSSSGFVPRFAQSSSHIYGRLPGRNPRSLLLWHLHIESEQSKKEGAFMSAQTFESHWADIDQSGDPQRYVEQMSAVRKWSDDRTGN